MANTLTSLIPSLHASLDIVSRERTGMIPAVTIDGQASRAAKDQAVIVGIAPINSAGFDITPAMAIPAAADQVIGNTSVVITKSRGYPFSWNGEEQLGLNSGSGYDYIRNHQMTQCIRALVNEMEADLCALHATTSRAYGTAGTTPFGTSGDFTDATFAHKILKDNGAPESDNQLVVDTTAGANFGGKQSNASVSFDAALMQQGILRTVGGLDIRESGQIVTSTAGAMASATTTSAAFTVGQIVLPLATAGTGVVAAGDIITLANDTNKYVVTSVSFAGANPASGDTITIAAPGLRKAQGVATRAITVIAAAARNMVFNRSAIVLAQRLPARPKEKDLALDVYTMQDPRTGLSFEVAVYPGNRMVRYEISAAWGVKNIKPEHTALLLG